MAERRSGEDRREPTGHSEHPVVKWALGIVGGLLTMVLLSYGVTEFQSKRNAETNKTQWQLMPTKELMRLEIERAILKHYRTDHDCGG